MSFIYSIIQAPTLFICYNKELINTSTDVFDSQ